MALRAFGISGAPDVVVSTNRVLAGDGCYEFVKLLRRRRTRPSVGRESSWLLCPSRQIRLGLADVRLVRHATRGYQGKHLAKPINPIALAAAILVLKRRLRRLERPWVPVSLGFFRARKGVVFGFQFPAAALHGMTVAGLARYRFIVSPAQPPGVPQGGCR